MNDPFKRELNAVPQINQAHQRAVTSYWDFVAPTYLSLFRNELEGKPFDQLVIRNFAEAMGKNAIVCDAGCGPCAHITSLLGACGLDVFGIDLSPVCIDLARQEKPSLDLRGMDATDFQLEHSSLDGLVAYYLFHYIPKATWSDVLRGFARVLKPGGKLLIVMKDGQGEGWISDPMGGPVKTYWAACSSVELERVVESASFTIGNACQRSALPEEIRADRMYLLGECT